MSKDFGDRLRMTRLAQGLRQADLAAELGVSLPTVRLLETGEGKLHGFSALAGRLGLELVGHGLPAGSPLGARLLALRERNGRGKVELAAQAGVSPTSVAALERGDDVRVSTLLAVGGALRAGLDLVPAGQVNTPGCEVATGGKHWWPAPSWLVAAAVRVLGAVDLDPCSPRRDGPVPAATRYTETDGGLSRGWPGRVFVCPPYGRTLPAWLEKAASEHAAGRASSVIALVPARTDAAWCRRALASGPDCWLLRRRLRAGGQAFPFGSLVLGWGLDDTMRWAMSAECGGSHHLRRLTAS